jgi:hypothetical protein
MKLIVYVILSFFTCNVCLASDFVYSNKEMLAIVEQYNLMKNWISLTDSVDNKFDFEKNYKNSKYDREELLTYYYEKKHIDSIYIKHIDEQEEFFKNTIFAKDLKFYSSKFKVVYSYNHAYFFSFHNPEYFNKNMIQYELLDCSYYLISPDGKIYDMIRPPFDSLLTILNKEYFDCVNTLEDAKGLISIYKDFFRNTGQACIPELVGEIVYEPIEEVRSDHFYLEYCIGHSQVVFKIYFDGQVEYYRNKLDLDSKINEKN